MSLISEIGYAAAIAVRYERKEKERERKGKSFESEFNGLGGISQFLCFFFLTDIHVRVIEKYYSTYMNLISTCLCNDI